MYFFGLGRVAWAGVRWNPDELEAAPVDQEDLELKGEDEEDAEAEEEDVEELDDPEEGSYAPRLLLLLLLLPLLEEEEARADMAAEDNCRGGGWQGWAGQGLQ